MPFSIQSQQRKKPMPRWLPVKNGFVSIIVCFPHSTHFLARVCLFNEQWTMFIGQWIMVWHRDGHEKSTIKIINPLKCSAFQSDLISFVQISRLSLCRFISGALNGFLDCFLGRVNRIRWNMHVYHDACCVNWLVRCIVLCSITMSSFRRY